MSLTRLIYISPIIVLFSCLWGCKKEYSCEGCADNNKPPIANAGPDQVIILPANNVLLDGSGSNDTDGTITNFQWSKIAGPASFNLRTPGSAQTTSESLVEGVYLFGLKVTDDFGLFDTDTVQITVSNATSLNRPPIADAGTNQTINLPPFTVNLNGNLSSDPDYNIVSYLWTKISGPSLFTIVNTNTTQTQVTNLVGGVYEFELKVTDAGGLFDLDTVQIHVMDPQITGNVLFFFRDPTGSLDAANITVIESFTPQTILARVKIANFPDANIEGVWGQRVTPWCPISSIYADATSFGTFNLPPGTYTWSAESVTTNLSGFPGIPAGFLQYWSTPHSTTGTITVQPGATCIITEINF